MSDFEIKLKSFVELADVANEKVKLKTFLCVGGNLVMVLWKRRLPCLDWSSIPVANVLCRMQQRSIVTYLETA